MSDESVVRDLLLQLMERTSAMQEVQAEIRQTASQTLAQATRTNGRVDKLELWQQAIDAKIVREEGEAAGRKAQRADDLAVFGWFQTVAQDWWPLALGALLGGVGIASFIWDILG